MEIIIIGSDGQLGKCLQDQVNKVDTKSNFLFCSRLDLDISDHEKTNKFLRKFSPNIIINASGYTNVDLAEKNIKNADAINNYAVENLANIANKIGATLLHISTDYVFNGKSSCQYSEIEPTDPLGIYGKTKLSGEQAIILSGCKYIIIRTSWVFSEYGNNFLKSILKLISERESISVVSDQLGCPTYAQDIAKLIIEFISKIKKGDLFKDILHFSGDKQTSWFEFANKIYDEKKRYVEDLNCSIKPVKTSEYKTLASRPLYSVLDCTKIQDEYGVKLSNWNEAIKVIISKLY